MKRLILYICVMTMSLALSAQSLVSVGARGGFDFMVPSSDQSTRAKFGAAGAFDLGYTYYWTVFGLNNLGLHTGISAGYASNESQILLNQQFTNYDYMDEKMQYTITGKTTLSLKRAYAEIPLMAAFRSKNIIAQLGLKAQYAFWSTASQQVTEASIDAHYAAYNVHVTDELVTGIISPEDMLKQKVDDKAPAFNLLLAMRIGYEFRFNKKYIVGVAAYMDCNVWNNLSLPHIDQPHISVEPITNPTYPVPAVTVNNAYHTVISRIHPIQVGVSVYCALEYRLYSSFGSSKWEDL